MYVGMYIYASQYWYSNDMIAECLHLSEFIYNDFQLVYNIWTLNIKGTLITYEITL